MPQPRHRGEYPKEWPEIAKAVKDEARWCCERCGAPHQPAIGRTLTVHHFDGDKANCSRANLMPLCQACHLSVQARVDPEVPLLFVPSAWALPYVAAFYESGRGVPSPIYDLSGWAAKYEAETKKQWPEWVGRKTG